MPGHQAPGPGETGAPGEHAKLLLSFGTRIIYDGAGKEKPGGRGG
jgi:hypothetical protein